MYLAKTLTLRSLPEIGRRFGGRDHTTVLHAVRKIEGLVGNDADAGRRDRGAEAAAAGIATDSIRRRLGRGPAQGSPAVCRSPPAASIAGKTWVPAAEALRKPRSRATFDALLSTRRRGCHMKVTVERAELLKSLGHVHRVVERRNTIPILANVLVRAEKSAAEPEGHRSRPRSDRDDRGRGRARPARPPCRRTCSTTSCASFPKARRSCSKASGDRAVLAIRAGRSRFTLQTLPESDFPDLAAGDMTHKFTLAAADLKRLIDKTQFAISTEETRYYLNGIYLHVAGSGKGADAARGRDRRPPPGADRICRCRPAPPACRASSCRARPWARCSG